MTEQTWVVVGASSPVARSFALAAAEKGYRVILVGRDVEDLSRTGTDIRLRYEREVDVVEFDVLDFTSHAGFPARCSCYARGALNIFVAVGAMPSQEEIDADFSLGKLCVETNYLAIVSMLAHFAPVLEQQRGGRILVLGSVAGDRGRLKNYVYGSSKAGLHTYLQGLRARLWRVGVSVTTVKPGFIDTGMTWGRPGVFLVASPADCARACLKFAERGADVRYYPSFWWVIMSIIRLIPESLFKRTSI